jgi:hypothetical protein
MSRNLSKPVVALACAGVLGSRIASSGWVSWVATAVLPGRRQWWSAGPSEYPRGATVCQARPRRPGPGRQVCNGLVIALPLRSRNLNRTRIARRENRKGSPTTFPQVGSPFRLVGDTGFEPVRRVSLKTGCSPVKTALTCIYAKQWRWTLVHSIGHGYPFIGHVLATKGGVECQRNGPSDRWRGSRAAGSGRAI